MRVYLGFDFGIRGTRESFMQGGTHRKLGSGLEECRAVF